MSVLIFKRGQIDMCTNNSTRIRIVMHHCLLLFVVSF